MVGQQPNLRKELSDFYEFDWMNIKNENAGVVPGARKNFKAASNRTEPETGINKNRACEDRRGPDMAHRRTREQLSKAIRFLEAGDLDNCRVALHVGLEWAVAAEEVRRP